MSALGSTFGHDAISILRAAYAAFNRGDIDAALTAIDPHVEWTEPPEFPGGGTCYGVEGVRKYLTDSRAGFTEGGSEPERFTTAGDHVVVFVHAHVLPKGSDEWRDSRHADVFTFSGDKIIRMHAFTDRDEALRYAGVIR